MGSKVVDMQATIEFENLDIVVSPTGGLTGSVAGPELIKHLVNAILLKIVHRLYSSKHIHVAVIVGWASRTVELL